jgi:hypothetical protein
VFSDHVLDKLLDHEEERRQDMVEWKRMQRDVVDVIIQNKDVDDDLIHRLIGILNTNCLGFSFRKEKVEGRALYPLLSIVSHSCVANARYAGITDSRSCHSIVFFLSQLILRTSLLSYEQERIFWKVKKSQ